MKAQDILSQIIEYKKSFVEDSKRKMPQGELESMLGSIKPAISFIDSVKRNIINCRMSLIAEIKKASPSKGLIREDFDPIEIAKIYKSCGVTAISVLTDEEFFCGSLGYFDEVRKVVDLPLLRKDFIVDEYQIYESRVHGADIILLISSVLDREKLIEYSEIALSLGMETLVEVHSEEDFDYYLKQKMPLIGINNRDLRTFSTDIKHTIKLVEGKRPINSIIISESGISTYGDVECLFCAGISGILVGETFMKEKDICRAVKRLMNAS